MRLLFIKQIYIFILHFCYLSSFKYIKIYYKFITL